MPKIIKKEPIKYNTDYIEEELNTITSDLGCRIIEIINTKLNPYEKQMILIYYEFQNVLLMKQLYNNISHTLLYKEIDRIRTKVKYWLKKDER